jgi:hypothetical protein
MSRIVFRTVEEKGKVATIGWPDIPAFRKPRPMVAAFDVLPCPLSPQKGNRQKFHPKNLVFLEKFALPLPKIPQKLRKPLVKPEGTIPQPPKNA